MLDPLINAISSKAGVSPDQARAGLGLILKLAQKQAPDKYAKLQGLLPEVDHLVAAAPQPGALGGFASSLLGGLGGGKLAGLASLVSAAQSAGLDEAKLISIAQQAGAFLEAQGHGELAGFLKNLA
jgi:hypothetical protein